MTKEQAIQAFWSSFGLPAYDSTIVPKEATMPYITYSVTTSDIDHPVTLDANLWYYSSSWKDISLKKDEIAEFIGIGGKSIPIDKGYMYVTRGTVFAQRMTDENNMVRRYYLQINVEFLTAN